MKEPIFVDHKDLFAIPEPKTSPVTDLAIENLPERKTITGDPEVDLALWLGAVCKTATTPAVLDCVLEEAQALRSSANDIGKRYADFLYSQPGVSPLQAAMNSFSVGEIARQVESARERLEWNALGLSVFGSSEAAFEPTPAEQMLFGTAKLPEDVNFWSIEPDQLADAFAESVNPASLTEVIAELRYWQWLYQVRKHMGQTADPGGYASDPAPEVSAREDYLKSLLTEIGPTGRAEALRVADALADGLIDIGSVGDGENQAKVLDHLLRTLPEAA